MDIHEELTTLEDRIATAVTDCETWRATGLVEQYLEAYDLVEALHLQLRRRLRLPAAPTRGADLEIAK